MVVGILISVPSCTQAQRALRIKIVAHSQTRGVPHGGEEDRTIIVHAQGGRIRIESPAFGPSPSMVTIQRCDTRVMYALNSSKREYTETRMPPPEQQSKAEQMHEKEAQGQPNLVIDTATVDTGETKSAFGHKARHYITTTKQIPSPELAEQPSETVVDAWYLDIPDVMRCQPASHRFTGIVGDGRTVTKVRPEFRYSGAEPEGLILSQTRISRSVHVFATGEKQQVELVGSHEIVEMSEVPVDSELFEVPSGYTKVTRLTQ